MDIGGREGDRELGARRARATGDDKRAINETPAATAAAAAAAAARAHRCTTCALCSLPHAVHVAAARPVTLGRGDRYIDRSDDDASRAVVTWCVLHVGTYAPPAWGEIIVTARLAGQRARKTKGNRTGCGSWSSSLLDSSPRLNGRRPVSLSLSLSLWSTAPSVASLASLQVVRPSDDKNIATQLASQLASLVSLSRFSSSGLLLLVEWLVLERCFCTRPLAIRVCYVQFFFLLPA